MATKKTTEKTADQADAERREAEVTHRPTEADDATTQLDPGLPSEATLELQRQAEEREQAAREARDAHPGDSGTR